MFTLTTVLDFVGTSLVVAGVAMFSVPAALIAAGVAILVISWGSGR